MAAVRGIGVDLVDITDLRDLMDRLGSTFVERVFSRHEVGAANQLRNPAKSLAERFAVKEAVFKALSPFTDAQAFDLRSVETLTGSDGRPAIDARGDLGGLMAQAGVARFTVSTSTGGNYAIAFVVAWQDDTDAVLPTSS